MTRRDGCFDVSGDLVDLDDGFAAGIVTGHDAANLKAHCASLF